MTFMAMIISDKNSQTWRKFLEYMRAVGLTQQPCEGWYDYPATRSLSNVEMTLVNYAQPWTIRSLTVSSCSRRVISPISLACFISVSLLSSSNVVLSLVVYRSVTKNQTGPLGVSVKVCWEWHTFLRYNALTQIHITGVKKKYKRHQLDIAELSCSCIPTN